MNVLVLNNLYEHEILSPEENNRLAILAKNGDVEAKDKVVLNNLLLIKRVVNKYKQSDKEYDDLFQTGAYGILRAINTYNEEKGLFSTYAYIWIRAMILNSFREMEDFHYELEFYNKCIRFEKLKSATGQKDCKFTDAELYDFNLTKKDLQHIELYSRKSCSLDALTNSPNEFSNQITSATIYNLDDSVVNVVFEKEMKELIFKEMKRILDDKEFFIIIETYGMESGEPLKMTKVAEMLSEISDGKNYSRQRIQQIRTKAEKKLSKSPILKSLFSP